MMRLPTLTDPHPSTEWLRAEQARLRSQADTMLADTRVMDVFARHGQLSPIEGSYEYELMIYPDLDIGLYADTITKQDFASLVADLAAHPAVNRLWTADTVNFNLAKFPRPVGYWVCVDIPFENDRWGIDCWFMQPDWKTHQKEGDYAARLAELDQQGRDAVLAIKYQLIRNGTYGKQYQFADVYDAVLERGIRSVEDFKNVHKGA